MFIHLTSLLRRILLDRHFRILWQGGGGGGPFFFFSYAVVDILDEDEILAKEQEVLDEHDDTIA